MFLKKLVQIATILCGEIWTFTIKIDTWRAKNEQYSTELGKKQDSGFT